MSGILQAKTMILSQGMKLCICLRGKGVHFHDSHADGVSVYSEVLCDGDYAGGGEGVSAPCKGGLAGDFHTAKRKPSGRRTL